MPNIGKVYLSPVLDGFNGEIISYSVSSSADFNQLKETLTNSFTNDYYGNTILHSEQGWQYQHEYYHTIKSEMFYGFESTFKSLKNLERAIDDHIFYYNNQRIRLNLKGLSPVQYRTKSFS